MHNLYGKYSRGGAETAVELMANNYQAAGHKVFLITTCSKNNRPKQTTINQEEKNNFKIYYLSSEFYNLNKHSQFYRALWQIGNIFSFKKNREIKKILKAEKPDLIITHNLMGLGFSVPKILQKLNLRQEHFLHDVQLIHPSGLIIFGQEQKINTPATKIYQALTRALFASPAKIISPSRWLMDMHAQRGFFKNSEIEIRPFIWPSINASKINRNKPAKNFLFIGQIEKQKGIFLLINAFKKINNPELTLTIAIRGGGASLAKARTEAQNDRRIKFFGPLSYEEADKIKLASDCLIVPSLCYENSPTTIYGARTIDLPVIAANIGGIPEIVGQQDKLFRPGDEDDLRKKIIEMASLTLK